MTPEWWVRFKCAFLGHPNMIDPVETGAQAHDLIAGTGSVEKQAWCPVCEKNVYWAEDYP